MSNLLQDAVQAIVKLADDKKAGDICVFHSNEDHWLTEYIVVLTVNNSVHARSILMMFKEYFSTLTSNDDLSDSPNVIGKPESGWVIVDANSIVIHCVNAENRDFYEIDKLFSVQGEIHYH